MHNNFFDEEGGLAVAVEPTDDGLFLAYLPGRAVAGAVGDTPEEARENLLAGYELAPDVWADFGEAVFG